MAAQARSIHQCFRWIYFLLYYSGCLCFRLHNDTLLLTAIGMRFTQTIRFVLVMGFIGGFALKLSDEESAKAMFGHLSPVLKLILAFEGISSTITYVLVAAAMDFQKNAHLRLAQRFQQLDEQMGSEFPNIRWNYHKSVRKYTPITIFVLVFYYIAALIYLFNLANCYCDIGTTFLISVSYSAVTVATGCAGFLHMGGMDLLRIRYRLIHKMADLMLSTSSAEACLHLRFQRLIWYYKCYTELIPEMNSVFGIVCAANVFYDFSNLTSLTFLLCQKASETEADAKEFIFILLFMTPRMYKVLVYGIYGYMAGRERKCCFHKICSYVNLLPGVKDVQKRMEAFWYWKMQHNYHLTIGKTIPCNLYLLFMVLHGITNYVIILIQLTFQQNSIAKHLKNHGMARHAEAVDVKRL